MSRPFIAQYRGACIACDGSVEPGQEVRFVGTGWLEHVACPKEPTPGPICGGCQMEIPAGLSECPDCG